MGCITNPTMIEDQMSRFNTFISSRSSTSSGENGSNILKCIDGLFGVVLRLTFEHSFILLVFVFGNLYPNFVRIFRHD